MVPPAPPVGPAAALTPELRDAIKAAWSRSKELLDDERFAQAAELLQSVITPAAAALGAEHSRVLPLRSRRAASLVLGGDYRQALPELDALISVYHRTAGPGSPEVVDCLRQAAYCRAELGQATAALSQFRQALTQVRAAGSDGSGTALDLRRNIGSLLAAEGRTTEAIAALQPLHDDLCVVYGRDDPETQEVAEVLARLRRTGGGLHRS